MKNLIIAISAFLLFISVAYTSANCAPQQTLQQKSPGSDSIDVVKYIINIDSLNISAKFLSGHTHIYFKSRVGGLNFIPVDLLKLSVDSIFLESSKISTWTHNDTLLMIQCPAALNDTDTFHLEIYYHGSPVVDPSTWGGFYFQNPYAYNLGVGFQDNPHNYGRVWFPCIDDFTDKAFYEIKVTTDTNQMAVCGGSLTDTAHVANNSKIEWTWEMSNPIPTYLASVAVGPYVCVTDTFNGINGKIPIDIYVASSLVPKVSGTFINLKNVLTAFENRYGPYLWERVGYVGVPFNSGAMEHATNIAMPNAVINGSTSYETLIYHELSHHWFGDLVTCETAEEMWINEGWAVFSEFIMKESIYGYAEMQNYVRETLASVLKTAHLDDGGFFPVGNVPHEITYGTTVYYKGALVAHTLRNYIGDSLFFPAIKQYFDSLKFGNANNTQLREILSLSTGIDLTDFFEAWVLREGFPHFDVDSMHVVPQGSNAVVTVYLRQKLYGTNQYANNNRVELTFMDSLWNSYTVTANFSGQTGSDVFTVPFVPSLVIVDKDEKTADAIVSYNNVISTPKTVSCANAFVDIFVNSLSDSIFIRAEHHKVAPDQVLPDPDIFRISKSRYWRISGIIPYGTNYQLRFNYNRTGAFFDTELLPTNSSVDSLILVYRPGAGHEWQVFPFTKTGNAFSGFLKTPYALKGEYALAIGKPNQSSIEDKGQIASLVLYPNPCPGILNIKDIPKGSTMIQICDINGKVVVAKKLNNNETETKINLAGIANGDYFVITLNKANAINSKAALKIIND